LLAAISLFALDVLINIRTVRIWSMLFLSRWFGWTLIH
jgi:hypothetical protein